MIFLKNTAFLSLVLVNICSVTCGETSSNHQTNKNATEIQDLSPVDPEEEEDFPPADPEKEDLPHSCPTLLERLSDFLAGEFDSATRACLEEVNGVVNGTEDHNDDLVYNNTFNDFEPVDDNTTDDDGAYVHFDLYVALWPGARSIGWIVGPAITKYLDVSLRRCAVAMDREDLARVPRRNQTEVDMILMSNRLNATIYAKESNRDWWHYSFKFECYETGTQVPVNQTRLSKLDHDVLASLLHVDAMKEEVLTDIETVLNTTIPSIFDANLYPPNIPEDDSIDPVNGNTSGVPPKCFQNCCQNSPCTGEGCVNTALPCEDPCNQPCPHNETYPPPASPTEPAMSPTFIESLETPLDIEAWNARRYAGLGLLIMTVVGTFLLMQLADIRRRHRIEQANWGNLATEQGVDRLLRMGWKLDGSKMEVYEKRKIGYGDNDSMLIGGFQQTVLVGAEITVSQSETTPGTP